MLPKRKLRANSTTRGRRGSDPKRRNAAYAPELPATVIVSSEFTPDSEALRDWILSKRQSPPSIAIELDTDLLGTRVIDSLDFAEFLFVIEETYGQVIELEGVRLETFRSLASIKAHFTEQGDKRV